MSVSEYHVPLHTRLNRVLMKPVFRSIFRVLGRVKILGKEHVPYGKPYVVAFNHISIFDPPLVLAFWPEMAEAIGAADVFLKKGQGPILRMYGVIPVHRGEYDRALFERIFAILKSGRPVVMAPEGGRSHATAMRRALPGVGYIIERAHVPVVPVGLMGTTDDFWQRARQGDKPQLEIRIGRPIHFAPMNERGAERREARQRIADDVMRTIAGLLPAEYHGYYQDQGIYQDSL